MKYMFILAWALLWAPVYSDSTSALAVYARRDYRFLKFPRRCLEEVCGNEPSATEARAEYENGTPTPAPDGAGSTTSVGDNDAGPTDGGSSEEESAPSSPASAQEEGEEEDQPRRMMSGEGSTQAVVMELWMRGYSVDKPNSTVNCRSWRSYQCSTEDKIKADWPTYPASEIVNDCRYSCRVSGYRNPPAWYVRQVSSFGVR